MAVILLEDCVVSVNPISGYNVYKIVTPATAGSADTIDVSSIVNPKKCTGATCQAETDGLLPVAIITTAGVLTIPGSTAAEARTIHITAAL